MTRCRKHQRSRSAGLTKITGERFEGTKMRLLIIRHGEPDYKNDTLTPRGWKEAELLADRLCGMDIQDFYVSSMGRAKDTASCTLKKMGREAIVCDWLREIHFQNLGIWGVVPSQWKNDRRHSDYETWQSAELFENTGVQELVRYVTENLDRMLADHGYVREGKSYRVTNPNKDTVVLFCHFGLESVLLSHLLQLPFTPVVQGMIAAPASITALHTEEREEGIAIFRMNSFGDTAHLYAAGQETSPAGRFQELYGDTNR